MRALGFWGANMAEQAEGKEAEAPSDNPITKYLGSAIFAVFIAFLAWLSPRSTELRTALTTLGAVLAGVCALVTSLLYGRYLGVLRAGAEPADSLEGSAYVRLWKSLAEGGKPALIYADWLTRFLDAVDHFFGDAGIVAEPPFRHMFGLKTAAALWTAPAFDRCLVLALIYPIVTILFIWAISGRVGPAEAALGLQATVAGWRRLSLLLTLGIAAFAGQRAKQNPEPWFYIFLVVSFVFVPFTMVNTTSSGTIGWAVFFAVPAAWFVRGSGHTFRFGLISLFGRKWERGRVGVTTVALFIAAPFTFALLLEVPAPGFIIAIVMIAVAMSAVSVVLIGLNYISTRCQWQGVFLSIFTIVAILICLVTADLFSQSKTWKIIGPLLLFFGLLPPLNTPFDWASLGLTRALLRRGLELGGWWPFLLALVDALLAAAIIALLSLTMVIGVQAFDDLAAHGGGGPVLPLGSFFDGIEDHPTASECWWVYALLFSTMIPSVVNLIISGASLMRGVPGVPSLLLKFMPANKAVPAFDRAWVATVLTLQLVGGAILGIVVQFALIYAVFGYVMPWLGLELLDMARAVAAFDLPGKIIAWL
jgi:hypothetical protein